ncbi:MAG: hypothetical protein ACREU7_07460 [Burkholderiales bacterium]
MAGAGQQTVTPPRWARVVALVVLSALIIAAAFVLPPVAQPPGYHDFADRREWLGVPYFLNSVSNVALLAVGLLGLRLTPGRSRPTAFLDRAERIPCAVFFASVALTCFGSVWYHLAPDDARLVWDRLPMALGFMAFLAMIITERIGVRAGLRLLLPLMLFGVGSVWYWQWTAARGAENVLPYVVVQYYSALLVLALLRLFPPRYSHGYLVVAAFAWYVAAKAAELLDHQIFAFGEFVSGHTLKHLLAAVSAWQIHRMVRDRRPAFF